jgi:hypothetical protein
VSAAADIWAGLNPQKVILVAMVLVAALSLLSGAMIALMIWAYSGLRKDDQKQNPDPYLEPGSHKGLRVGPITAPARLSETSQPGTPS